MVSARRMTTVATTGSLVCFILVFSPSYFTLLLFQGLYIQGRLLHLRELAHDQPQRVAPVLDHPSARCNAQSGFLRGGGEWPGGGVVR